MRFFLRFFYLALLLMTIFVLPVYGQANISLSAEHAVVIDEQTGEIVFSKNAHEQTEIASLTKIMTAIVAIEHGDLSDEIVAKERAIHATGSSIYLQQDETMSLEDLLYGLMLRSGNDAAVAIAEHIGGSVEGFTLLMNEKVKLLGLESTTFKNPHGLDEVNHLSTAYDVAQMMRYSMKNDIFRKIAGAPYYQSEDRTYRWNNKNRLLTELYEYCIAGKTGFTKKAGRTLVTTAAKGNQSFIVVTLNAPDDWNDHIRLYEWAFTDSEDVDETDAPEQYSFLQLYKLLWGSIFQVNDHG